MRKFFTLPLFCAFSLTAMAQKTPVLQPYGKVDQADLEMKDCDFEKGANAMVLFDHGVMDGKAGLPMGHHTRIKIFNDFGKGAGVVILEYLSTGYDVGIADIKGETINLENGKIEITPLDKKQIYKEEIDKWHSALKFAMPNVKAGSIIEFTYREYPRSVWNFQNFIPVRYSEVELNLPATIDFKSIPHVKQPYVKSVGETTDTYQVRAMANIHSMPNEPYISSRIDNLQHIEFIGVNTRVSTWPKIGKMLINANDFGYDLDRNLTNEAGIIKKAKELRSADEKIAFIFDTVRNSMKWNDRLMFYTQDGTVKAWDTKSGNSAEINMIVYHLLKKADIKAYPLIVCTKNNGKLNPANPTIFLFNNTVVYVPVDSTKNYVLDASGRFNQYNVIPKNILNSFGLSLDPHNNINFAQRDKDNEMVFIKNDEPAMRSISINAEIKTGGKMEGNAELTSYSYNKVNALRLYNEKGQDKYLDTLRNSDNNLTISSFKRENMEVDSLPLTQQFNFKLDLSGSDENYIYFNTNLFNGLGKNPFFSDERFSDIDFGYMDNFALYGVYKLPTGYKTDALPKPITIVMPDQSIIFKRTVVEDDGAILVKYVLNHKKTIYFREEYQDIQGFYKKMHELLNEQVVLKKI